MKYRQWTLWIGMFAVLFALSACASVVETAGPDSPGQETNGTAAPESHESAGKKTIRLGSSLYAVEIARSFSLLNVSNEYWEDDMVARYHNEDTLLDFAVYQFSKEDSPDTLEEFTREEAEEYEASEIVTDMNVNGIPAAYYLSAAIYGGVYRDGLTLVLENEGEEYIEIDFWFVGYQAESEAWEIVRSLTEIESKRLTLGAYQTYQIWIPADFTPVSDKTDNPAVYENGSASLRVYIGSFPAEGQTLAEFVRSRGGSDIETDSEVNGIPAAFYRSVEALDGAFHSVWTCVLAEYAPDSDGSGDNTPDGFITLAFRLDGISAEAEAEAILDTLSES